MFLDFNFLQKASSFESTLISKHLYQIIHALPLPNSSQNGIEKRAVAFIFTNVATPLLYTIEPRCLGEL